MNKILFATTNKNKIDRLKNFLGNVDFEILTLTDLDYSIPEPDEIGDDPVAIATNKAKYYWERLNIKIPVLAQDDTIEFLNIPELSAPRLSIKQPVIDKYDDFTDTHAIKFYTDLARTYGGRINMRFNYGFAVVSENIAESQPAQLDCTLVDQVSNKIQSGYFLTSIIKLKVDDKEIFYSEMTSDQQAKTDVDLENSVRSLLEKLNLK